MYRLCWDCGARTDDDRQVRCDCGEPLWLESDPEAVPDAWPPTVETMWNLVPYLGLGAPTVPSGIASGAGGTPLLRTERLDPAGSPRLHVKPEGLNPTGSFKDRGTAFGVAWMLEQGEHRIGTVSHGNMAASVAAHAAASGLDCTVLVPADIAEERLAAIAAYGPRLLRADGDYGKLYVESLTVGRETGVRFLNSDAPLRVAGQATTALEALAQFAARESGATPDALVMPVSSGGHASGAWQAVRTLDAAGIIDEPPRLYFVQAAACAPIAEAFARGDDTVTPVDGGETVAYSIANANPPSGNRALAAARATSGAVCAVDDDAILEAKRRFAVKAGLTVEPASATTLAAVEQLVDAGSLSPDDDVALIATGRGFGGGSGTAESEQVTLDELGRVLRRSR
jgi:Threonine synthase